MEQLRRFKPRLYNALVHHRNTKNVRLSFDGRPYLIPIYEDNSQEIVVIKSVQCGISEYLIVDTLTNSKNGLSIFYVLPKYELRNTFVSNRIDKLFNMVKYYRLQMKEATGTSDARNMKHYGPGTIKFASSNTISDFAEFPADVIVIDELDRCDQKNLPYAKDRIKASRHKLMRKVSNPTITGFGISDEFKNSDQKQWVVKCGECGYFNELDFFKVVVRENNDGMFKLIDKEWSLDARRDIKCYCAACEKPFDRLGNDAHWERRNPSSIVSGYHISRMMDIDTKVSELWKIWDEAVGNETKKQAFHNSDLGVEYESKGAKLTDFLLDECVREYVMPDKAMETIMGIDVGAVLHVNISSIIDGEIRKKLFIGTVAHFEDIDRLIEIFGVRFGVCDSLPETHEAKKLRDRHSGKVWLCDFHTREGNTGDLTLKETGYKVLVDRTQIMDETHADILKERVHFPINAKTLEGGGFYDQMKAPTRILDPDSSRYVWREGSKDDHYRLADVYEKIAWKILRQQSIFFETSDRDVTPENED